MSQGVNISGIGPVGREQLAEFLGRDAHPSGGGRAILKIVGQKGHQFEWHPQKRIVYLLRFNGMPHEAIATDIETHGHAIAAVQIYTRGFIEGQAPGAGNIGLIKLGGA